LRERHGLRFDGQAYRQLPLAFQVNLPALPEACGFLDALA